LARRYDVAVMHDFFVDRLVHARSLAGTLAKVAEKAEKGGGGLHGVAQEEVKGGNAVNLALALARLGLKTLLVTHSDRTHEPLLRHTFEGLRAELRIKPLPAGLTVAFEERVNVMLGDSKGASDFGPDVLDDRDWEAMANSTVVCTVNWAANKRGTELLKSTRKHLGEEKTIFFDPADFRDRVPEFAALAAMMAKKRLVDWVSMNEYEGAAAAEAIGVDTRRPGEMCRAVAGRLGVVFDLHGIRASYASEGTRVTSVPVRRIRPKRITGAGDVWDAAAIYGRLARMDERSRLRFANTSARLYLESEDLAPPTVEQVEEAVH
jgi:ribokinase